MLQEWFSKMIQNAQLKFPEAKVKDTLQPKQTEKKDEVIGMP